MSAGSGEVHGDARSAAVRTQQALAALIARAAPEPWLLAVRRVEDLDAASLATLAALRDTRRAARTLFLTSGRTGGPTLADPFVPSRSIELDPIEPHDAREFVISLAPTLRDDEIDTIVSTAAGNPLLLHELASHPRRGDLPDSLQRLGAEVLDLMPPATSALLRDVSVFGARWSPSVVAEVLERPSLAHRAAWSDAAPLVRAEGDGTMRFRYEAIRAVAHDMLSRRRRRQLHGAIADRLATQPGRDDAELALHLEEANRLEEAFPLAADAGLQAKRLGAVAESIGLLERAVGMATVVAQDRRSALLVELGEARTWLGDPDSARRDFLRAGRDRQRDRTTDLRRFHLLASMCLNGGNLDGARRWANRGLSLERTLADQGSSRPSDRGYLLLDLAAAQYYRSRWTECVRTSHDVLDLARSEGDTVLEGLAHLHLEMAHGAMMNDEAVTHGDEAVLLFESVGHDRFLAAALTNSAMTAMFLGRFDEALRRYRTAVDRAARRGNRVDQAFAELDIGFVLFRQGLLAEADEHARRATRVFRAMADLRHAAFGVTLEAMVAVQERRIADADALLTRARADFASLDDLAMVADVDVVRMEHLMLQGRDADVLVLAGDVEPILAAAEFPMVVEFHRILGAAEARLGDGDGLDRVRRALRMAEERRLVYEAGRCRATLEALGL